MDDTTRCKPSVIQKGLRSYLDQQMTLTEHPFQATQWNTKNSPLHQVDQHQQIPDLGHQSTVNDQNKHHNAGSSFAQPSFPHLKKPQNQHSIGLGDPAPSKDWYVTEHPQSLEDQEMHDPDDLGHVRSLATEDQTGLQNFTTTNVHVASRVRKRKVPTLKATDWDPVKSYVIKTHIEEGQPLEKVIEQVRKTFGFIANKRQYRTRISQWKKDKNIKKTEMQAIVRKQQRRNVQEPDKPPLWFTVRDSSVNPEKIHRWMRRNNVSMNDLYSPASAATTPSALECKTISELGSPAPSSFDSHRPTDWAAKFACKDPSSADIMIVRWQTVESIEPEPLQHQEHEGVTFASTSYHAFEATGRLREKLADMSSSVVHLTGNHLSKNLEDKSDSGTSTERGFRDENDVIEFQSGSALIDYDSLGGFQDDNDVIEFQFGPVLIDHDSLGSTEDITNRLPGKVKQRGRHDPTDSSKYRYDSSLLDDIQLLAQSYISHGFRVEIREAEDFQIPALYHRQRYVRRVSLSTMLDAWAQAQDHGICYRGYYSSRFDTFDIRANLEAVFGPDCVATLWARKRHLSSPLCHACDLALRMDGLPSFTADLDEELHSFLQGSPRIDPDIWWYFNSSTFFDWLAGRYDWILGYSDNHTPFPFDNVFGLDHPEVPKYKFIVDDAQENGAWSTESIEAIIRYNKFIEKKRKVDISKPLVLLAWKE
ncbi:hypothetical protein BU24DRAFT_425788 [Aaosphaeria arxii CBS 175.79]|uniref:Clr5 domain-containing protein n=1 Tax=Aaosphaeria arxii CBS 175.79 TaxID=1450172 RepID=A0A6A5XGA4_9PLEO|nr:uncharacterized protein BU24DRAFT_425788 [Aaosphaeria arxii CBS 175.79]KAF2011963.1 hypothetical protein BU24DRAFT_425788 [Aaosphaeria arxii CBS 175.79]